MKQTTAIIWFVLLTLVLSFSAYFLPLPAESKALLVPVVLVFIPTLVCIPLAWITEGRNGLRQLFSRAKTGIHWLLLGLLVGAGMRILVLLVGTILKTPVKADFGVPGTWFVVFALIPLAFFEELGWRRYALDRLLKVHSPFASALLLGLPWAIIHLVIVLPGMMSVGSPVIPQTIVLVCLGILITWIYVRSGGSVLAATMLHGSQNSLVVINRGLTNAEATWLMLLAYLLLAAVFVIVERRLFFSKWKQGQPAAIYPAA
jgi:hypothetical protein